MTETPIWEDIYYTSTADTLQYIINDGDEGLDIFSGKAYRFPNGANLKINVTSICANYLDSSLPANFWAGQVTSGYFPLNNAIKTFNLLDEDGNLLSSYTFVNDYSYDLNETGNTFSYPINNKWATNMYELRTAYNGIGTIMVHFDKAPTGATVACGDYALYYQNMRMGWDSLLIEGKVIRTDDYEFSEYIKDYDNKTRNRGSVRYLNQIQPKWQLNTGWLTEAQAAILAEHLLSSNDVWLHNLKTGEIIPVSITDSNAEYKVRGRGRSGKRISYAINVKAANKKYKR